MKIQWIPFSFNQNYKLTFHQENYHVDFFVVFRHWLSSMVSFYFTKSVPCTFSNPYDGDLGIESKSCSAESIPFQRQAFEPAHTYHHLVWDLDIYQPIIEIFLTFDFIIFWQISFSVIFSLILFQTKLFSWSEILKLTIK